jgi:hypothetical protein
MALVVLVATRHCAAGQARRLLQGQHEILDEAIHRHELLFDVFVLAEPLERDLGIPNLQDSAALARIQARFINLSRTRIFRQHWSVLEVVATTYQSAAGNETLVGGLDAARVVIFGFIDEGRYLVGSDSLKVSAENSPCGLRLRIRRNPSLVILGVQYDRFAVMDFGQSAGRLGR